MAQKPTLGGTKKPAKKKPAKKKVSRRYSMYFTKRQILELDQWGKLDDMSDLDIYRIMAEQAIDNDVKNGVIDNLVTVKGFDKLFVDFAEEQGASMIIRGLRAVSDFEYEFQMTGMNRRMNADIETVFLMASEKNQFIASSMVN